MDPGKLNKRVEVWRKSPVENELGAEDFIPAKVKTIWAGIVPQTGSLVKQQNANTLLADVTHKIIIRYDSGKDIRSDDWLMYFEKASDRDAYTDACSKNQDIKVGHRFDIKYPLDPFYNHETLELFCTEKIE